MNALANDYFPKRLAALRESKGVSRQIVADELGISRASLEYYEKGQRVPDIVVLSRIADYFNVSADYLLGRSDVRNFDPSQKMNVACEVTGLSPKAIDNLQRIMGDTLNATPLIESDNFYEIVDCLEKAKCSYINKEYLVKVVSPLVDGNDFYNNMTLNNECLEKYNCKEKRIFIGGCSNCIFKLLDKDYVYDLICTNFPGVVSINPTSILGWRKPDYYVTPEEEFNDKAEVAEFRASKALSNIFNEIISSIDYDSAFVNYNDSMRELLTYQIELFEKAIKSLETNKNLDSKYDIDEYKARIKAIQTYLDKYDENFKLKEDTDNGSNNPPKE